MQVPFVFGPGDLRLNEVPTPRASPGDVVLRVGTVGVCGSDLAYVAAGGPNGPSEAPVPLGHELTAVVAHVGKDVTGFAPGNRVVVNPLINLIGNGGPEGGFAPWLLIRDVDLKPQSLLHLPDSISMDHGALVEPLAVGMHAVNQLGAQGGDKVAIFGAGPIGLCALAALRHKGVSDTIVFDLSPFRRERALQLGAMAVFDPREVPLRDALARHHGTVPLFRREAPATTHFIEASGAPVLEEIIALARTRARICVVALHKKPANMDFAQVMTKELTLTGAMGYPRELEDALAMLAQEGFDPEPLISHRFGGADVMDAFAAAADCDNSAKVLVRYDT
ncbi:zinc-dependent alcohol dehydrogenase [Novosphingobium malaysiense]|uniref:Alcohol dehydrogenase n=1 Tax=Novosphingobium malaysiense TaxID=1348853 RepID=A0A0B1ZFJ7_9SPHN|nr:zinc-binding dehydrogenase [Novosphingobium malaysiense]KHK89861.1 hypothetical protein LK12_18305 [Novosphingobium malaysiense]